MSNLINCDGIIVGGGGGGSSDVITLYKRPDLPTHTISYFTGDEGWQIAQGLFDNWNNTTATGVQCQVQQLDYSDTTCRTLLHNNPFGNKIRFTDELGGTTYTNGLMLDNLTGIWWYKNNDDSGSVFDASIHTANDVITAIEAYTDPLGNSDYHCPLRTIINSVTTYTNNGSALINTDFDSAPISTRGFLSATPYVDFSTTRYIRYSLQNRGSQSSQTKTSTFSGSRGVPYRIIPQPTTPNP